MKNFRLPKWMVLVVVAALFLALSVDWVAPGGGARLAMEYLGGASRCSKLFPLWGWLVGLAGRNVVALGWISLGAGLVCVWLVAMIFGSVFGAAVRKARDGGAENEAGKYLFVENAAVLIAALAFALTPGLLFAATRISPLLVALVPPLAAVALLLSILAGGASSSESAVKTVGERLRRSKGRLLVVFALLAYSTYELIFARQVFALLAFPALWAYLAIGVMSAFVLAWCVRRRSLVSPRALGLAFGAWALAVLVMGALNFTTGGLSRGRDANALVQRIIANAEEGGKVAFASDGVLDELLFFMLPERMTLISMARERDPAYGRELSDWVRASQTKNVEDLSFAAELGPRALIDEWARLDAAGFDASVATVQNFFPTREKWNEACDLVATMRADEPFEPYLRHLLGVTGNALGCRMIEADDLRGAWSVFRAIVDTVEPKNYGAHINLLGMIQRGYAVPKDEADELAKRRREIENELKTWERLSRAARAGGRLYADPKEIAAYEKARREQAEKRGLSEEAKALVATIAAAPKDPKSGKAAQEAIHKAIREGKVRTDLIGGQLITIDLALGDIENAEKDAIEVLRLDRHDPSANALLGALAGERGDYERSERYLRRALATGKASIAARNDLAYSLYRMGRFDEAEPLAREAIAAYGESWTLHETLAAILLRKGRIEEGEKELVRAEELAAKAGIAKGKIASLAIDRARLLKAKGDDARFKMAIRQLQNRDDLSGEQREEVKRMDW